MFCTIALSTLLISAVNAQWPTDSYENMVICNHSGEQAIPLVAPTSDGGCYICWYDNASGNYDMYLQRLDANGIIQFAENGLLISDNAQDSWLTTYDMTVDQNDNAIIVFNDVRSGGDWDIYAYRISPTGEFLWGDDGIAVSDNDIAEYIPTVTVTTGNNVVIAWLEETVVKVRKFYPNGTDFWGTEKELTGDYTVTYPHLAPAEDDAVIVQVAKATGSMYYSSRDIYMYKYTSDGTSLWAEDGVLVCDAGGFSYAKIPYVKYDGNGGAYSFWYDARVSNELHSYAQHMNSSGAAVWEENGILLSSADKFQMTPDATVIDNDNVMFFFITCNSSQSNFGVDGQMVDASTGELLWHNEGIELLPLSDATRASVIANSVENDAIVTCFDYAEGSQTSIYIDAIRINAEGGFVWADSVIQVCSNGSDKTHLESNVTTNGQVVSVWEDARNGDADIYMQNINPDGTFGPYSTGIDDNNELIPAAFDIVSAYPNPFNAQTIINYNLSSAGSVTLDIYDLLGRKVQTLAEGYQAAGNHQVTWNAESVSSGVYFAKLSANDQTQSQKLVLLK